MFLSIQCTAACPACGHQTTPVNSASAQVECRRCGAALALPPDLWSTVINGVAQAGAELADNAGGSQVFASASATLRVAFQRRDPCCPHCGATWGSVPQMGPWACPNCSTAVQVRPCPYATAHAIALVAEDPGLDGTEGVGLPCRGCGFPLKLDARRVVCDACQTSSVVPDGVYRRANAPDTAARWWLARADATAAHHPLERVTAHGLALGADGVLYITGSTSHLDFALLAFDPATRTLRWTLDLAELEVWPIVAPLGDGRVAIAPGLPSPRVYVADEGGLEPLLEAPDWVEDMVFHDGALVLCCGSQRTLVRVGLDGSTLRMWRSRGFFKDLFFGGSSEAGLKPGTSPGKAGTGRLGIGHDGDLRMTWYQGVARYAGDGVLRWFTTIEGSHCSILPPVAAADGTTHAVMSVGDPMRSHLVRLAPDGTMAATVLEADVIRAIACESGGNVWVFAGDHEEEVGSHEALSCYDPAGNLLWRGPVS